MLKKQIKVRLKDIEGKPFKVLIKPETHTILQKLKIVYAQTYAALIKRGVATRASMLDLLRKENIWTDEQEERLNGLITICALAEANLDNALKENKPVEEQKTAAITLTKYRNELMELVQVKSEPLEFVAETIAEDIQREHYLVESVVFDEGGKHYFSSYEDFKARREEDNTQKIYEAFYKAISQSGVDMMLNLPENIWFTKNGYLKEEVLSNENTSETEKEENPVKIEVAPEVKEEQPPKE